VLKTYTGSCHCGALKFEADLDLTQSTFRCNCSICKRTRFWPAVAKEDGFRIISGESELIKYTFNSHKKPSLFLQTLWRQSIRRWQWHADGKNVWRQRRLFRPM